MHLGDQPSLPISPHQCYQDARTTIRQILGLSATNPLKISFDSNIEESIVTNINSISTIQQENNTKIEHVEIKETEDVLKSHKYMKLTNKINLNQIIELNETNKKGRMEESLNSNLIDENTDKQINQAFLLESCQKANLQTINQSEKESTCYDQYHMLHSEIRQNLQKMNQKQITGKNIPMNSNLDEIQQKNERKLHDSSELMKSVFDIFENSCFVKTNMHEADDQLNHSSLSFQIQAEQKYDRTIRGKDTFNNIDKRRKKKKNDKGCQQKDAETLEHQAINKKYQLYKKQCEQKQKISQRFQIKPIYQDFNTPQIHKQKINKNQILKGRYYQAQFSKHIEVVASRNMDNVEYYQWKLGTVYVWKSLSGAQRQNFDIFIKQAKICGLQLVRYLPKNPFKNKGKPSKICEQNMQYIKDIFNTVQFDKLYKFEKQNQQKQKYNNLQNALKPQSSLSQCDTSSLSQKSQKFVMNDELLNEKTNANNKREVKNSDGSKYYFNIFEYCDMEFIQKLHNIQKKCKNSIQVNNFFIVKSKEGLSEKISKVHQQNYEEINDSIISSIAEEAPMGRSIRLRTKNPLARNFLSKKMDCFFD